MHTTDDIRAMVAAVAGQPDGQSAGGGPDPLGPEVTLESLGVDSLRLVELVRQLESIFGVTFADTDLALSNFATLGSASDLVARYVAGAGAAPGTGRAARTLAADPADDEPAVAEYDEFPLEGRLLMHTARLRMSRSDVREALAILRDPGSGLDWARFADLAARHRVLNLVALNFDRERLDLTDAVRYWTLRSSYLYNRHRNQALSDELRAILGTCARRGVNVVLRKGTYLTARVYPDLALRFMVDLDFYVPGGEVPALGDVLRELGYRQGNDTPNGRVVEDFDREELIFSRLHEAALPPFRRPTSDPYVELITVDASHNLMPPASTKSVPAADFLERARRDTVAGEPAWVCSPEDTLLDLGVHLYREATSVCSIEMGKDLCLIRFLDIVQWYRHAHAEIDVDRVVALAERYDLAAELYYALHFTDLLYPQVLDADLLRRLRPADLTYLDEYGALENLPGTWPVGFLKRLFDPGRGAGITLPHRP